MRPKAKVLQPQSIGRGIAPVFRIANQLDLRKFACHHVGAVVGRGVIDDAHLEGDAGVGIHRAQTVAEQIADVVVDDDDGNIEPEKSSTKDTKDHEENVVSAKE